jgi:hypothetical protein
MAFGDLWLHFLTGNDLRTGSAPGHRRRKTSALRDYFIGNSPAAVSKARRSLGNLNSTPGSLK